MAAATEAAIGNFIFGQPLSVVHFSSSTRNANKHTLLRLAINFTSSLCWPDRFDLPLNFPYFLIFSFFFTIFYVCLFLCECVCVSMCVCQCYHWGYFWGGRLGFTTLFAGQQNISHTMIGRMIEMNNSTKRNHFQQTEIYARFSIWEKLSILHKIIWCNEIANSIYNSTRLHSNLTWDFPHTKFKESLLDATQVLLINSLLNKFMTILIQMHPLIRLILFWRCALYVCIKYKKNYFIYVQKLTCNEHKCLLSLMLISSHFSMKKIKRNEKCKSTS